MPVKTGALAAATVGTQQERQAKGLDMFSPGHLPLYEQGGIPIGGKILAQNYYSPFGIANDPAETATGLLEPWLLQPVNALGFGIDWLGKPLDGRWAEHEQGKREDAQPHTGSSVRAGQWCCFVHSAVHESRAGS